MKNRIPTICVLFLLLITALACKLDKSWRDEAVKEKIQNDEIWKKLDNICRELPKPYDFELFEKDATYNIRGDKVVEHKYKTSLTYEEVRKFYDEYFQRSGWELQDDNNNPKKAWFEYKKNDNSITIQRKYQKECSITCAVNR